MTKRMWALLATLKKNLGMNSCSPVWYPDSKRFAIGGGEAICVYAV